jgi:5-methylcytosine-specific restriction endonuclease McrA
VPYANWERQKEFVRLWTKARRKKWFSENGPCVRCGSKKKLELDHIDPSKKVSHSIWSWSKKRRDAEIKKCQVLCKECHLKKTIKSHRRPITHGNAGYKRFCRCRICKRAHSLRMKARVR